MDKYHIDIDLGKGDDIAGCIIMKGATSLAKFYGPRCEGRALQWVLARTEVLEECERSLMRLSMRLGNPAVEATDSEGLAGGVVDYALARMERAEADLAAAQRELEAYEKAVGESRSDRRAMLELKSTHDPYARGYLAGYIGCLKFIESRVSELLTQEGGK